MNLYIFKLLWWGVGHAACDVTVMRGCAEQHLMPQHSQSQRALGGGQVSARGRGQGAADADCECE
jgi:hypothetical protein